MNDLSINKDQVRSHETAVIEQQGQYLTFLVADEALGIAINDVKEIIEITSITHVPMTPDYIRGVINLRGNVVPVVDLSARLGHQVSELSKRSCIVLVEVSCNDEKQSLGMLVDQVKEILDIPEDHIQPAPTFGTNIRVEFIQAMGRVEDEFIILLEISRVLSVSELAELSLMTAAEPAAVLA
ncbi:chemotaxis protein CheW [Psychromonas aquimarina]|uniref:chemotaxis protein CheW n=1 Tax=Psychromonas aquimarina TaxID=444919 RepID=UPI00042770CF|nr:chemotaxis protein CheW [Psychromonas aquimarina]